MKAVPLLLVGVGICIAFRANVFNIGGEGQIAMGGLAGDGNRARAAGPPQRASSSRSCSSPARSAAAPGARSPAPSRPTWRQRDPEHDHAEPRRGPADELPAGRAAARQDGGRRSAADPADRGSSRRARGSRSCAAAPSCTSACSSRVLAAVAAYVLLWRTSFGFRLRAVGLSRDAATLRGHAGRSGRRRSR